MTTTHDQERCPACGAALDALRTQTDAERTHEVAEELRAKGNDVTDAEVDADLDATAKALGG